MSTPPQHQPELKMKRPSRRRQMSFGGCGFLGVYHAGVGQCVVDHAPHLFEEFDIFYGTSAGAITAVCAACKSDPMEAYKWVKKTFEASRKYTLGMLHPSFDLYSRLRTFLNEFLPKNAHRLCRKRVKISLSTLGSNGIPENLLVSDFNTRQELINAIIASSFIPGYAGFKALPKFRGKRCFDGGFTSNIPFSADPNVISVTPFSGGSDICPESEPCSLLQVYLIDQPLQISSVNIFRLLKSLCPTSWDELEQLYHEGYRDALKFFRQEGVITDPVLEPKSSKLLQTDLTLMQDSESMSVGGDSGYLSHTHSRGASLSVTMDVLSTIDERDVEQCCHDDDDYDGLVMRDVNLEGRDAVIPLDKKLMILSNQYDDYVSETDENDEGVVCGNQKKRRSSVISFVARQPVNIITASFKGMSWVASSCRLTQLPVAGIHRLSKSLSSITLGQFTNTPTCTDDDQKQLEWEAELSHHDNGIVSHMLSRWPSSMIVF